MIDDYKPRFFFNDPDNIFLIAELGDEHHLIQLSNDLTQLANCILPIPATDYLYNVIASDNSIFIVWREMETNHVMCSKFSTECTLLDEVDMGDIWTTSEYFRTDIFNYSSSEIRCGMDCNHFIRIDKNELSNSEWWPFNSNSDCIPFSHVVANESNGFFDYLSFIEIPENSNGNNGAVLIQLNPTDLSINNIIQFQDDNHQLAGGDVMKVDESNYVFSTTTSFVPQGQTNQFRYYVTDETGEISRKDSVFLENHSSLLHRIAVNENQVAFHGNVLNNSTNQFLPRVIIYDQEVILNSHNQSELAMSFDVSVINDFLFIDGEVNPPFIVSIYSITGSTLYHDEHTEYTFSIPAFKGPFIAEVIANGRSVRKKFFSRW